MMENAMPDQTPKLNVALGELAMIEWDEDLFDVVRVTEVVGENLTWEEALALLEEPDDDDEIAPEED